LAISALAEDALSGWTRVQANGAIGNYLSGDVSKWKQAAAEVSRDHLETASLAWQAYRRPTPEDWSGLLDRDLSMLPQLGQAVIELLEELPMAVTGLAATEMRMLELISGGGGHPYDVFPGYRKRNKRRVFEYWEVGTQLDGLARCPVPAVSGLDEGPFTEEMHDHPHRYARYKSSSLALTPLGEAILGAGRGFQPPQCDPPLVGRDRIDQRSSVALGRRASRFDRALVWPPSTPTDAGTNLPFRHGRACPGHPRFWRTREE
jgi:hypothetical protein